MYRYIAVHPDDQPVQKIVCTPSADQSIREFQLCTKTYGTKAAPYLALKTLKQLAEDERDNFSKAKPYKTFSSLMTGALPANQLKKEKKHEIN